jgi:hypothetical protein
MCLSKTSLYRIFDSYIIFAQAMMKHYGSVHLDKLLHALLHFAALWTTLFPTSPLNSSTFMWLIRPVNFSTDHKNLLSHLYQKVNKPMVAIPRGKEDTTELGTEFFKIEIALRSAQEKEYVLDKEETSYDDILDALRLAVWGYRNLN